MNSAAPTPSEPAASPAHEPGPPREAGAPSEPSRTADRPVVLIPRPTDRGAGLAGLLRASGIESIVAPVVEQVPPEDTAPLDQAVRDLAAGRYPWVAVTSVAGVDAIAASAARIVAGEGAHDDIPPAGPAASAPRNETTSAAAEAESSCPDSCSRPSTLHSTSGPDAAFPGAAAAWAVVGPATARALRAHGVSVSLVPAVHSGAGLVAAFRGLPPTRVLAPLGDLAAPTLPEGLRALGWRVDVVTAYRTVPVALPPAVRTAWAAGRVTAVVLTSGSVARQVAEQLGPRDDVVGVAIGGPSARAARAVGLRVDVVADAATDEALAEAIRSV